MGKDYLDITAEDFELAKTDDEVFNKIYQANEKLIDFCLEKCSSIQVPKDELYNILVDGLIKAINRFDCSKNSGFGHFAIFCMMNRVKTFLRQSNRKRDVLWHTTECVSMDKEITGRKGDVGTTIGELLSDNSYEKYQYEEKQDTINTDRLLSFLSERTASIFRMYFGGVTQTELAKTLGIEQSSISSLIYANKLMLRNLATTALNVHSYVFRQLDLKDIASLKNLSSVIQVKYYEAVYQYLYNNANNVEEVIKLGQKARRTIPTIPDGGKSSGSELNDLMGM